MTLPSEPWPPRELVRALVFVRKKHGKVLHAMREFWQQTPNFSTSARAMVEAEQDFEAALSAVLSALPSVYREGPALLAALDGILGSPYDINALCGGAAQMAACEIARAAIAKAQPEGGGT